VPCCEDVRPSLVRFIGVFGGVDAVRPSVRPLLTVIAAHRLETAALWLRVRRAVLRCALRQVVSLALARTRSFSLVAGNRCIV